MPPALTTAARIGFPVSVARGGTGDRGGDVVCLDGGGRHEEDDDGIDSGIREHDGQSLLVALGGRGAEHVDRVRRARLVREEPCESRLRRSAEARKLEARGFAGIRTEDAEPARVREHRHPPAARRGAMRVERSDVEQLLERGGPRDPGPAEERFCRLVGAGERGGVRARCPGARASPAALQGEHRLPAGDAPGDARELPRVAERLEVEEDDLRLVLVLPVLEQVVGRDVGLVADGHERREPQPACARRLEQREPEGAALGREADRTERKRLSGERRVDARRSHGEPEAVRPEQAGAVGANQRQQPLLALRALAAHLGETGGQHAEGPRPPLERLAGHLEHARGRDTDHGQIDGLGKLGGRADGGNASDRCPRSVHRIGASGEAALDEIAEHRGPDRSGPGRRADHGDALGSEERLERRDDGLVVAAVDVLAVALGRCDREQHLDRSTRERPRHVEAGIREDAEHGAVLGQDLRHEARDADRPGRGGELLEQPRADALPLQRVLDRECDLCRRRIAEARPAGDRHDPLLAVLREAPDERVAINAVRIEERRHERRAHRGHAVKAVVEALRREPREERHESIRLAGARPVEPQGRAVSEEDVTRAARGSGRRAGCGSQTGCQAATSPRYGSQAARPCARSGEGTITSGQRAWWAHCWLTEPSRRP